MRSLLIFAGLLLCFALTPTLPAFAQTPAAPAGPKVVDTLTVVVPEAEVRAGPSEQFYVTTKLRAGARVEVVGQSDKYPGWLAIKPPVGSFSWINGTFVHETPEDHKTGIVAAAAEETLVPIYAGSSVIDKEPNVETDKVKRGFIITIIGSPNYSNGGRKVPILPTPRELRYIRANQVDKVNYPNGMTPDPKGQDAKTKVSLAEQKLRESRNHLLDAYNSSTDPVEKKDVLDKLAMLPNVPGGVPTPNPTLPGHPNPNASNPAVYHQPVAQPSETKIINTSLSASTPTTAAQWSTWGTLRKANFNSKDGQPMYVLTSQQEEPLLYAVAVAGKSLESQVGRLVSLYGTSTYQSEYVRMNVMTVTHVSNP